MSLPFLLQKNTNNNGEKGQALIIVVLVLVIVAIISTGIAFRTISDIRRTGLERSSIDAFTYAESAIEDISSQVSICMADPANNINSCLQEICNNPEGCTIECKTGDDCPLLEGFSASECNEISLKIKPSNEVSDRTILKDEAVEYYVDNQSRKIDIDWSGRYLVVTFISYNATQGYFVADSNGKETYFHKNPAKGSGISTLVQTNDGKILLPAGRFSGVRIMRVRALGANANVDITGLTNPAEIVYSSNGFCGNVSRSVVVTEPVLESMDGIFDYVLYTNVIQKDLAN